MRNGAILKFVSAPMLLYCKKCLSRGECELLWLNNVSGVYLVQVSLLLIVQQGLGHFFRYQPMLPLAGGLCRLYANAGGK
jgi:hypothetical protein